ncbi:Uncharacterized protein SCF082_LOCUS49042 [Durusdinium trenchii]|uniref:Uncharacterized protein n=1 Tax=Durusdinium trenchii TaxID=1381693 RepID=A0ABP0RXD7_9DINO
MKRSATTPPLAVFPTPPGRGHLSPRGAAGSVDSCRSEASGAAHDPDDTHKYDRHRRRRHRRGGLRREATMAKAVCGLGLVAVALVGIWRWAESRLEVTTQWAELLKVSGRFSEGGVQGACIRDCFTSLRIDLSVESDEDFAQHSVLCRRYCLGKKSSSRQPSGKVDTSHTAAFGDGVGEQYHDPEGGNDEQELEAKAESLKLDAAIDDGSQVVFSESRADRAGATAQASAEEPAPEEEVGLSTFAQIQETIFNHHSLKLWLRADAGVELGPDDTVQSWTDQSKSGVQFFPTPESSHTHEFFGHEDHESSRGEPTLKFELHSKLPVVQFPCSLETRDAKLTDEMTLLFVVAPEAFLYGPSARGQRFFGHYPNGQFRFADGTPSLFSNGDGKLARMDVGIDIRSAHGLVLLKYKLQGAKGVQIGVNKDSFHKVSTSPVDMSSDSVLSVGGVSGGCGFRGGIAEILAFEGDLSDAKLSFFSSYLETKWWTDLGHEMPSFHKQLRSPLDRSRRQPQVTAVEDVALLSTSRGSSAIVPVTEAQDKRVCIPEETESRFLEFLDRNPVKLWLKADQGVVLETNTLNVLEWDGVPPGNEAAFTPGVARSDPVSADTDEQKAQGPTLQTIWGNPCTKYVSFGCSLITKRLALSTPSTIYLVARSPELTSEGEFQRLFGHFPNGGLFLDSSGPVFKSKHGFLSFKGGKQRLRGGAEDKSLREKIPFQILKFRVGDLNGVEIGISQGAFRPVGPVHDALFSRNQKLTIGGVNGGCEKSGGVGEVLVFDGLLDDSRDKSVIAYLRAKWEPVPDRDGFVEEGVPSCTKYDPEDSVLDWIPGKETSKAQQIEWQDLVHVQKTRLAATPKASQHVKAHGAVAVLRQERRRIFGDPCRQDHLSHSARLDAPTSSAPIRPNPASSAKANSRGPCQGQQRPFSNDILSWKVPSGASREARQEWQNSVDRARARLTSFDKGGSELQALLLQVASEQNALRDKLFANVCDDDDQRHGVHREDAIAESPQKMTKAPLSKPSVSPKVDCSNTDNIMDWVPPPQAPNKDRFEWEDRVAGARKSINSFQRGGAELHDLLRKIVRDLALLRENLFASNCM